MYAVKEVMNIGIRNFSSTSIKIVLMALSNGKLLSVPNLKLFWSKNKSFGKQN